MGLNGKLHSYFLHLPLENSCHSFFFYGELINISVPTTMRCCPLTSVATVLIMATILHIMTPASTIKSGIKVWTDQSRGEERSQNPSWRMVTILFLGGVLHIQDSRAQRVLGWDHPRQQLEYQFSSLIRKNWGIYVLLDQRYLPQGFYIQ